MASGAVAVLAYINMLSCNARDMILELLGTPGLTLASSPESMHPSTLSLSESVALVWQCTETGEVDGRTTDMECRMTLA